MRLRHARERRTTSAQTRHVAPSIAPSTTSAQQHHTRTAHSVPVAARSLRENSLDDTTKASLKEAAFAKTGFTLEL